MMITKRPWLALRSSTWRRVGAFGLLFFAVKGLLWLAVPLLLVWLR